MFTGPGKSSTKFGLRRIDRPSTFSRNNRNPSRRSASIFSEYSSAFSTATAERGLRYETECFGQTHSAVIPTVAATPTEEPRNRRRSSFIAAPRTDESSRRTSAREARWRELHCSGSRDRLPMIVASLFLSGSDGLLVHEQGENAPGKTGNRIHAGCVLSQP